MKEFVHLHNHSEYSLLDGMLRISEKHQPSHFLQGLAQSGTKAMALTDHGNMFGALDFYASANAVGIKPIVGCEAYIVEGKYTDKEKSRVGHITLLAKNYQGYLNLMHLNSEAYVHGFYRYPRIDKELLAKHSEGLIALSGCLKGFLSYYATTAPFEKACAVAREYADIMGPGNYYVELMDHGIKEEQAALPILKEIAKKLGLKTVATNDCHYEKQEDWKAHDINLCIGTGTTLNNPQRLKMTTHDLYFKSPEEMYALFAHTPEALTTTLEIAEKCDLQFPKHGFILPNFEIPPQYPNSAEYFKALCREGLNRKMHGNVPPEYIKQLEYEFDVIIKMGFDCYFLIVQDFIHWAREHGIPIGPGRGSGAGSIVAYSLDITRVDPIQSKLLFERFLNPDRISMPDLDIDMSDTGREDVINYVRQKYGTDRVSQIITFGTMKAKLAVRDVGRVMGMEVPEINRVAKMIPSDPKITLEDALANTKELQEEIAKNETSKNLFEMARKIEGLKRHTGIHAAGVLITRDPVSEYIPLARAKDGSITTQFEGEPCSELGLLKMDFLGLRTLTVIDNAEKMIRARHNPDFDINNIPLDDKKTYELLCACQTLGVFQLESSGMRDLIKKLQPTQFSDISALVALYRPGPMESGMMDMFVRRKNGQEKITYETPLLEDLLKDTYGCMVYQEQIMQISKTLGGFTPGEADSLRKAMGKKKLEMMEKFGKKFVEGAKANQIAEKTASHIYEQMKAFAGYGFNKSHSYAYALVAYQTAYLKANYPIEFMCAALTNEIGHNAIGADDKENKIATYLEEAKKMGFEILPPDVNKSQPEFAVEEKNGKECIRYALEAVKNAGTEGCISIAEQAKQKPFTSLEDMCSRIDIFQANKKALESLIKAGAMDCLMPQSDPTETRAFLLSQLERVVDTAHLIAKEKQNQTASLFGDDFSSMMSFKKQEDPKKIRPLTHKELLAFEKEVMGIYFSGHPIARFQPYLSKIGCVSIQELLNTKNSGHLSLVGIVTRLKKRQTRQTKEDWAQLVIEDCTGSISINAFNKTWKKIGHQVTPNAVLCFSGEVRVDDESAQVEMNLQSVGEVTPLIARAATQFIIHLTNDYRPSYLQRLKMLLDAAPGLTQVYIEVPSKADPTKIHRIRTGKKVQLHDALLDHLENTLGEHAWSIQ